MKIESKIVVVHFESLIVSFSFLSSNQNAIWIIAQKCRGDKASVGKLRNNMSSKVHVITLHEIVDFVSKVDIKQMFFFSIEANFNEK